MDAPALAYSPRALPLFAHSQVPQPSRARNGEDFLAAVREFSFNGEPTLEVERDGLRYFINELWTSGQRQAHSIHEISYRADDFQADARQRFGMLEELHAQLSPDAQPRLGPVAARRRN